VAGAGDGKKTARDTAGRVRFRGQKAINLWMSKGSIGHRPRRGPVNQSNLGKVGSAVPGSCPNPERTVELKKKEIHDGSS
jgi:hypothetical protein